MQVAQDQRAEQASSMPRLRQGLPLCHVLSEG